MTFSTHLQQFKETSKFLPNCPGIPDLLTLNWLNCWRTCANRFSSASWRMWNYQAVKKFSLLPSFIHSHSEIKDASLGFRVKCFTHYTNSLHCHQYIFANMFGRIYHCHNIWLCLAFLDSPFQTLRFNVSINKYKIIFHRICLKLCYMRPTEHCKIDWWGCCYSEILVLWI